MPSLLLLKYLVTNGPKTTLQLLQEVDIFENQAQLSGALGRLKQEFFIAKNEDCQWVPTHLGTERTLKSETPEPVPKVSTHRTPPKTVDIATKILRISRSIPSECTITISNQRVMVNMLGTDIPIVRAEDLRSIFNTAKLHRKSKN